LVAILDADKQGFLRSEQALIQTIGRAARHVNGHVIMYADRITDAMKAAIDETERRRAIQIAYNKEHGIEPASIVKEIRDLTQRVHAIREAAKAPEEQAAPSPVDLPPGDLKRLIDTLEQEMRAAAKALEFEKAAALRDQLIELRQVMVLKSQEQRDPSLSLVSGIGRRPRPTPN